MNDFIAYQYSEDGTYLGEVDCQRCPKNNVPLTPKNATKIAPPETKANEIAVFMEHSQEWIVLLKELKQSVDLIEEVKLLLIDPNKTNVKKAISILINLL